VSTTVLAAGALTTVGHLGATIAVARSDESGPWPPTVIDAQFGLYWLGVMAIAGCSRVSSRRHTGVCTRFTDSYGGA
jgi:hypothetical protein